MEQVSSHARTLIISRVLPRHIPRTSIPTEPMVVSVGAQICAATFNIVVILDEFETLDEQHWFENTVMSRVLRDHRVIFASPSSQRELKHG